MVGLSSRSSSRRRQKGTANGKTSTGSGPRPPRISTSLSEVIRITCRAEAAATIRSRTSAPPWPLMRFSLPSTSSAPSIVSALSDPRPTRSIPSSRARRAVSSDVGTPRTLSPPRTRAPSARTNALAARPEPRPTTSPSLTKPRACVASAASGSLVVAAMVGHAPVSKDTAKANGAGTRLLAAHPDQLLEEAPQRRQVREQGLECVAVHGQQVDARAAPHRRGPRALAHERDLPDALARAERAQRDVSPAGHAPEHVHLALDDDVEPVAAIALAEDHLVGLEVLPADRERFVGLELDDVGRQQQVERPIRRHAELSVQAGKLHEVDRAPEPPRQEPGDLQAEDFGDRRSVSERAHLAEGVECEGLAHRAPDRGGDVRGEAFRLANRVLGCRRARLSGLRVENPGAVADRPDAGVVRNLEMLVDDDPALLLLAGQGRHQWIRRRGHRTHDGARRDALAAGEQRRVHRRSVKSRVELDLHAAPDQDPLGELGERPRQLREDEALSVEEDDPDLFRLDVAKALRGRPDEVVQLGNRLHAGEAAAGHDEREQRATRLGRWLGVGFLERLDGAVAERERVAQVLARERVLGEPGLAGEARHVAERHDQVIVVQLELPRPETRRGNHSLALQVDPLDPARVEVWARGPAPDWRD